ncbi:MAG: recombinase family protein [Myxococcaceae bacterium]
MLKTSHFALYIRTSTADQDGAAQLHALRHAADARGWTKPVEFVDIGHSGAKASRPALDALKQSARRGDVRQVMVFALDRLGRSLRELLLLLDELSAAGCAFISLRESLDLTTPTGRLLVHLVAALAEFERELIRERVKSGLARVQATGKTRSGKPVGRPRRGVDLEAARRLREAGQTWREVARALKVPRRTLERACAPGSKPSSNLRPTPRSVGRGSVGDATR